MKLELISREPEKKRFATPLLFIHGTGHAAWCWDENFLPYFARKGFGAHAVSLRGHGASDGVKKLKWASIADFVSDVARAAQRLPEKPVVIGHSMGALVAEKYMEKHGAAAGIMVAPSPSEGMLLAGLKIQMRNLRLMNRVFLKQDFSVMFATPTLAKKFLFSADADEAKVAEYAGRFGSESFRANLETIYNLPRPRKIKAPILVIGAENDALVPVKKVVRTARAYKADLKIFADTAHDMMLEREWQKVADFMIEWLAEKIR